MRPIVYLLMLVSSSACVFTGENNLFEVVQVDDRNDRINFVYLTIDSTLLHQENQINTIVQDLINKYEITEHTSIVFYSKKEYVGGKVELFMDEDYSTPDINMTQWMNEHILGEVDFADSSFVTYPYSTTRQSKRFNLSF